MNDLQQLLRYEIPGLITIMYFLMLSYSSLFEYAKSLGFSPKQIGEVLPGLFGVFAVLALPLGFLVYQIYIYFEDEKFLRKRAGMKVVKEILEKWPKSQEEKWWSSRNHVERNEILDIIFYKYEKELAKILERFINFYHSSRVVGIYVPLTALIFSLFFSIYREINKNACISGFTILFLLVSYCIANMDKRICRKLKRNTSLCFYLQKSFCFHMGIFIVTVLILFIYSKDLMYLVFLLILTFSSVTVQPTFKDGSLKKRIDELETNILVQRKREIMETIRIRHGIGNFSSCENTLGINTFE